MELLKSAPFESNLRLEPLNSQKPVQSVEKVNKRSLGQIKMIICQRLVHDWQELADYFDIPPYQRAFFNKGREPQGVWEWLEQRNKLSELETALEVMGRNDLVKELNQ